MGYFVIEKIPLVRYSLYIKRRTATKPSGSCSYLRTRESKAMENHEEILTDGVWAALERRNISRRSFLRFCSVMAGVLALPASYAPRIAQALEQTRRPALIWRQFQDCAGNSESAIRAAHPTFADIVLELLSWNYHELLMVPSGQAAEKSSHDTV